jgi:hydrogenase-1 operon protein HyaF
MRDNTQAPIGPGTQPFEEDGSQLSYLEMPSGMATFSVPTLPEPDEAAGCDAALAALEAVQIAAAADDAHGECRTFDITAFDETNRAFVGQVLGEGEVAIIAGPDLQVQESVLAGIWRLHFADAKGGTSRDVIAVSSFPAAVLEVATAGTAPQIMPPAADAPLPDGVANAPALLTELASAPEAYDAPGAAPHVINLSLLPHTEGDLAFLVEQLGRGQVTVLSRGYGNCRISSTGTRNIWWVQYFNSQDVLILNTLEVVSVPEVARAAPEDLADSAERLDEILKVFK